MRPAQAPVGLHLTQMSRTISRAFDDALAVAGGSLPVWLVLLNLTIRDVASQRELAEAMGIRDATLTHHLNAMESAGLLTRERDRANRRIHVVSLTAAGHDLFGRLREAAVAFDAQLRHGLSPAQLQQFTAVLDQMAANVAGSHSGSHSGPPWAGLAEGG
jgi:MarR family transcriptional regulator for hemolysin